MAFPQVYAGQRLTAGLVTQMAPVNVSAGLRLYVGQSIATGTDTAVGWHDEYEDSNNGHDNVTNNSRWYAPYNGRYAMDVILNWGNSATGRRTVWLRVGGATLYNLDSRHSSISDTIQSGGGRALRMAAGEYCEVFCRHAAGAPINIDGAVRDGSLWTIDYIGP